MKSRAILYEAFANVVTGTSRALTWCVILVIVLCATVLLDVLVVRQVFLDQRVFMESGGATVIIDSPSGIDAERCSNLALISGVDGSFAARVTSSDPHTRTSANESLELATLPGTSIRAREVYGSYLDVLGGTGSAVYGIGIPSAYGAKLGNTEIGAHLPFAENVGSVSAIFNYPADGRDERFANTFFVPVGAQGDFDECVFTVWPIDDQISDLGLTAVKSGIELDAVTVKTLNSSLGKPTPTHELLADRFSRFNAVIGVIAGAVLGVVSVRARRLELALALSLGVRKGAQLKQIMFESLLWVMPSTVAVSSTAVLMGTMGLLPEESSYVVQVVALRMLALASAVMLGTFLAAGLISKNRIYDWFKDR